MSSETTTTDVYPWSDACFACNSILVSASSCDDCNSSTRDQVSQRVIFQHFSPYVTYSVLFPIIALLSPDFHFSVMNSINIVLLWCFSEEASPLLNSVPCRNIVESYTRPGAPVHPFCVLHGGFSIHIKYNINYLTVVSSFSNNHLQCSLG